MRSHIVHTLPWHLVMIDGLLVIVFKYTCRSAHTSTRYPLSCSCSSSSALILPGVMQVLLCVVHWWESGWPIFLSLSFLLHLHLLHHQVLLILKDLLLNLGTVYPTTASFLLELKIKGEVRIRSILPLTSFWRALEAWEHLWIRVLMVMRRCFSWVISLVAWFRMKSSWPLLDRAWSAAFILWGPLIWLLCTFPSLASSSIFDKKLFLR